MGYIKRILLLPFALILWTFQYSILWIKEGGSLHINDTEELDLDLLLYDKLESVDNKLTELLNKK